MKRELRKIRVGSDPCASIIETPHYFVTLEKGEFVKMWTSDWTLSNQLSTSYVGFCNLELFGENRLILPETDGHILIVNLLNREERTSIHHDGDTKRGELMCVRYVENFDSIVACYESGLITVWRTNGQRVCEVQVEGTPMCMDFCKITTTLVIGTSGSTVWKFSLKNDCITLQCKTEITNPGISSVSLRADGKLCVAACWDNCVRYFSLKNLKLLAVLDNRTVPNCVLFNRNSSSPEWGYAFVGSSDGRVTIWNLYSNKTSK